MSKDDKWYYTMGIASIPALFSEAWFRFEVCLLLVAILLCMSMHLTTQPKSKEDK